MKTTLCTTVISFILTTLFGCGSDDAQETSRIITKTSWQKLAFTDDSEQALNEAQKMAIVFSQADVYIGTLKNGIWTKKLSDAVYKQVPGIGKAERSVLEPKPTDNANGELFDSDNFMIDNMKPFSNGVVALFESTGFIIIKGGVVYATYAKGQHGWNNNLDVTDYTIISNGEEEFLVAGGINRDEGNKKTTMIFLSLKDIEKGKNVWSNKVTDAGDEPINFEIRAIVKHNDNLIAFSKDGSYLRFPKNGISKDGFKSIDKIGQTKLDIDKFKLNSRPEIVNAFGNGDIIFINFGEHFGVVSGHKLDQYQAAQKATINGFSSDGTKTLLLTNGYYIAEKEKLGPLINSEYTKGHIFVSKENGKASEQKDGWEKPLPDLTFQHGAMHDNKIYLLSNSGEYLVVSSEDIKIKLAD